MIFKAILFLLGALSVGWLQPGKAYAGETADKTLELESGLYYTIEKGDTLWDLSEHFYDSPWIWPELWQKNNKQIANPHWIYPGQVIRLFEREDAETIFEPKPKPEPAIEPPEPPYYFYPAINSVGFIRKEPVTPVGAIFKVKEDKVIISERDLVYIRPLGDVSFRPGDFFTVFRTLKRLKEQKTRGFIGIQHYIVGVLEVTDVQPKFAVGRIIQSFRPIELNDLLMQYEARLPKITLAESEEGLEGKIIASEERESIFGDHTVVFIDKGRKDGISAGQFYSIYYQEKERLHPKAKEAVLLPPVDYGEIFILRTEETTATALITTAKEAVEPGERIHAR